MGKETIKYLAKCALNGYGSGCAVGIALAYAFPKIAKQVIPAARIVMGISGASWATWKLYESIENDSVDYMMKTLDD